MGKLKQLHIDCEPNKCVVGQPETCYMLEKNQPTAFEVSSRDLFDKNKNPNLTLSPETILGNNKIQKRRLS